MVSPIVLNSYKILKSSRAMNQGIIFKIKRYALHDGPGIRTTIFLKGCPLACRWCHNPEGQRAEIETMRRSAGGNNGADEREPVGWKVSTDELLTEIEKDRIFFDTSGGGVTFSGGEPLMQADFLTQMLISCQAHGIHTVVDTSGYASLTKIQQVAQHTDLFLFDLKLINPDVHLRHTGCSNQPILENLKWLDQAGKTVIVRIPLIPGMTDDPHNIDAMAKLLTELSSLRRVDILPFHRVGSGKYHRLGQARPIGGDTSVLPRKPLKRYGNNLKTTV